MFVIRCDEATVYAAIAVVSVLLLFFALVRALVNLLGTFFSKAVVRYASLRVERLSCAVLAAAAVALFSDGSALLPVLIAMATLTSCAFCGSFRSFRWLWVSSFVFYAVTLFHIAGPLYVGDVSSTAQEWSALVRGQRVVLPQSAYVSTSDGKQRSASRYVFSYYDSVKIEGGHSPFVKYAPPPFTLSKDALSWWWGGSANVESGKSKKEAKGKRMTPSGKMENNQTDAAVTNYIVASGDETRVSYYTGFASRSDEGPDGYASNAALLDSIYLVGHGSRLQHSRVRCQIPSHTSSSPPPCLHLHSSTMLYNVTLYFADRPRADATDAEAEAETETDAAPSAAAVPPVWRVFRVGRKAPQSCREVRSALATLADDGARETTATATTTTTTGTRTTYAALVECVDNIDISALPRRFVAQAPFPVRFGWHFPGYLRRLQDALFLLSDRVLLPTSVFLGDCLSAGGRVVMVGFGRVGAWFVASLPHVQAAAEKAAIYGGGLVCGEGATPKGRAGDAAAAAEAQAMVLNAYRKAPPMRCAAMSRAYAAHSAFKAGARTRASAAAVLSALADATDLFPGVWTVYRWAWDAEVTITLWIVQAVQTVVHFVVFVLPRPLWQALAVVVRGVGLTLLQLWKPLRLMGQALARLPLLPYVSRLFRWLYELEARSLHYEWRAAQYVGGICLRKGELILQRLLTAAGKLFDQCGLFLARYGRTSFSIHLVVAFLQTLLLLLAMRNEMSELVEAERVRAPGPHSPLRFVMRLFPQSVASYLPLQSVTARVNGFLLLVRAHHQACMQYLLLHSIGTLVLIGLSVLPFTSKLYSLTLRYVLPWMSAKSFLVFFDDAPSRQATAVLMGLRMVLATLLQQTIGDFLYHIVKDILIAAVLMGGLALTLWAWPQRTVLARQVATAIADSLQGTPMPTPQRSTAETARSSPSPPQPGPQNSQASAVAERENGDPAAALTDAARPSAAEREEEVEDAEGESVSLNRRIDLSDAS